MRFVESFWPWPHAPRPTPRMKLRTHINLIVGALGAVFIALMLIVEIDRTRLAVSEEIAAANTVATQLLSRVAETYERDGSLRSEERRVGKGRRARGATDD